MGYIYLITNNITNEKYVGQTKSSIYVRFAGHIHDYKRFPNRKLYHNMIEYGADNFIPSLLEECDDNLLNQKETEWIEKLDTFKHGLNETPGFIQKEPEEKRNSSEEIRKKYGQKISQIDCETGEIIQTFSSQMEAGRWLKANNLSNIEDLRKLSSHLSRASKNHLKLGGYYWQTTGQPIKEMITNLEQIISKDDLKKKIRFQSFAAIGREYEVSDKTISRWCIKYNLPSTKKEISKYTDEEWEKL